MKYTDTNIYKDIRFSMDEIETVLINKIQEIRGQNWEIKSLVTYNSNDQIAKVDYYAFDPIMCDIFPNRFIINNHLYIAKQVEKKDYELKLANKKEIDMTNKILKILQKFIEKDEVIPIGTKFIKITSTNQLYDVLFDSNQKYNYLDTYNQFFNYSEKYDALTNEIIEFAEKRKQQKKLTNK